MSATLTTIAILGLAATSAHNISLKDSKALMLPISDAAKQVQVVYPTCAMPALRCIPCEQSPAHEFSTPADKPHNNGTSPARTLSKKKAQQKERREKLAQMPQENKVIKASTRYKKCTTQMNECFEKTSYWPNGDWFRGFYSYSSRCTTQVCKLWSRALNLGYSQKGQAVRCGDQFESCMKQYNTH